MNFMYVRCVIGQSQFIAAGGSGANETKVFDHSRNNAVVGTVTGLPRGVFAIDFAPDCPKIAIAGGDASIRILDIADKE
jgi:COMPASS component SWD3